MRKLIITAICICFSNLSQSQTPGEWVWMKGSNSVNSSGNYGVQGVETITNNPQSVYMPVSWTDTSGNFWIYGGHRLNIAYADLWKFNVTTNNWTWIKGNGQSGQLPIHGTQGVPNASNNPGNVRFGAATWTDQNNDLWLFGGYSVPPNPISGDLWKYNIASNTWTWMKGNQQNNSLGNYGVQGVAASTNLPPAKDFCQAAWTDSNGNLWQFGGQMDNGSIDDLWKYDILTGNWTWMKGSNTCCAVPVYGTKGIEAPANTPGARQALLYWKDNQGMFWLMGSESRLSDLWRYNPTTNNWAWMGGTPTIFNAGNYGTQCVDDTLNLPPGRFFQSSCWVDSEGNFWMFGGQFTGQSDKSNDLWKYNVSTGIWTWRSGLSTLNTSGNYGTMGVSSNLNSVPSRTGSVGWSDNNGNFWIFGGYNALLDAFNDMWRFTPDTLCGTITTTITEQQSNIDDLFYFYHNQLIIPHHPYNSLQISVYNFAGQLVSQQNIANSSQKTIIPIPNLKNGIYLIKVLMDNKYYASKKVPIFN